MGGNISAMNGKVYFNDNSGHYWRNWTPEATAKFENFVRLHFSDLVGPNFWAS
ncbi:hypothetical protein ACNOYE_35445 [Nannocystaceae bacterium ST9]